MTLKVKLKHLPKTHGGRLDNTVVFCNACEDKKSRHDAVWMLEETLQSGNEATDDFSHVGLTQLSNTPLVVKLMINGRKAQQEKQVAEWFRANPHYNIVQSICTLSCLDNPIRWMHKITETTPQHFCGIGKTEFIIVFQEHIIDGNMRSKVFDVEQWRSIVSQLTFAVMELYDKYGFLYGDWHFGNVLVDTTSDHSKTYKAFGKHWKVKNTTGLRPVLTDFSRSDLRNEKEDVQPWQLGTQIAYVWDMLANIASLQEYKDVCRELSIEVGMHDEAILKTVRQWMKAIDI